MEPLRQEVKGKHAVDLRNNLNLPSIFASPRGDHEIYASHLRTARMAATPHYARYVDHGHVHVGGGKSPKELYHRETVQYSTAINGYILLKLLGLIAADKAFLPTNNGIAGNDIYSTRAFCLKKNQSTPSPAGLLLLWLEILPSGIASFGLLQLSTTASCNRL